MEAKKRIPLAIALSLATLFIVTTIFAGTDSTTFPGTVFTPLPGSPNTWGGCVYSAEGNIYVDSEDYACWAVAPLSRQYTSGLTSVDAELSVYDDSSDSYIYCGFFCGDYDDVSYYSDTDTSVNGSDTLSMTLNSTYNYGHFWAYCFIPAIGDSESASIVYDIKIDENY